MMEGDLPEEKGRGIDFLDFLGPDTSAVVFKLLHHPADLARASAVSHSWRRFVIENQFSKIQCLQAYPEVATFTHIQLSSFVRVRRNAGSSACAEFDKLERDHRVYMQLSHGLLSPYNTKVCSIRCIGPSSTDRYPDEAMENTLQPADRVGWTPSYWSSRGHRDPAAVAEFLVYRILSDLCLVDEIKVQPLKAFFRDDQPIYSAKSIRFQMGYPKSPQTLLYGENKRRVIADSNYIWTYTSPEFPMLQENVLQSFKLPHPVLCIGGVVKIELLGGVVKDAFDGLYYICIRMSSTSVGSSELDAYWLKPPLARTEKFDILTWWKANSVEYPILARMARDVLAVPASTVASESAFSTGRRVISDFRSRLTPDTVEALICLQDWFRASSTDDVTTASVYDILGDEGLSIREGDEGLSI